jgi:hypothetical protein
MKILFLDVDGPLIPLRLHKEWGHLFQYDEVGGYYVWDDEFIKELNDHCPPQGIKIVFNSSHNDSGAYVMRMTALANGMRPDILHDDICTKYPQIDHRFMAIEEWLNRNVPFGSSCKWFVVDDMEITYYNSKKVVPNHIQVTLDNGVTDKHVIEIFDKFMHGKGPYWHYNEANTGILLK